MKEYRYCSVVLITMENTEKKNRIIIHYHYYYYFLCGPRHNLNYGMV